MFLVAANTRQALVGQKEWITTGSSGIQVQFLFSSDWDDLAKFAVFRNAEIEESVIPIALPASGLTELPAENCAAEYVDEKVYVGVYGTDGLGHIIIPTIWVSLGVLKEGAAYEGMDPPQPTQDMWAQILAIAQNAGAENAAAAEQSAEEAEASKEAIQDMNVQAETLPDESPLTVTKEVDPETGAVTLVFGLTRGPKGTKGDDGYSPTITITPIQGGHRFTVTDEDHPTGQSFDVMNGAPGAPGSPGQDGYSPAITITTITGGHRFTVTDEDHPTGQSFDVMDGTKGDQGYSPAVTITTITGGHRVTITDEDHPTGQSFDVLDGASDAGQVTFDPTQTYQNGTVGKALTDQSNAIEQKQDAPQTAGTAGQVLGLDSNLNPTWVDQTGGNVNIELEPYSSSKTYAVGDYCEYSNGKYQCNTPITTAEAWNSTHWTAITASDLIGDMNDRLDMVVTMQEVDQPTPPAQSSQLVDPEDIAWVYQSSKWRAKIAKIPLDNNGTYYPNPAKIVSGDTSEFNTMYDTGFYDAFDQRLTLTKTDQTTKNTLDLFGGTHDSYIVIENKRTIKVYARGTLSSKWTTTADIAYMGGPYCYIGYPSSDSAQIGITYEEQSNSYIPYGGGPAPEPEYEWNYTVPMAQFVEAYMQTHGTAASNNMFNFVYPERNNSEFANTLKYYHERFDRQKDDIIRIGSFNKFISRGRGNWSTIKQELADYALDICGFQESPAIVESGEITAQIGAALQGQQFTSYAEQNTTVSQAIVSHWEVTDTNIYTLVTLDDDSTRTAINAVIKLYPYKWYSNFIDNAATLSVYSYHGSSQNGVIGGVSKTSYELRMMEITELLDIVAQDTADFIVIVGDTNCFEAGLDTTTAKHAEWEAFRTAGYIPVLEGHESTVTADIASTHFFVAGDGKAYCDACYDQIFIGSNIEAVGHSVVDSNLYPVESLGGVPVSDHCMVYADLKFDFDAVMNAKMVAELS